MTPPASEPDPSGNSGENKRGRVENLRPWKPGQSGNPNGRPKGLARAVREMPSQILAEKVPADVMLARIAWGIVSDQKQKTSDRLAAWKLLAERGWGKPAEFAPIEDDDPLDYSLPDELAAELEAHFDELTARRARRGK